MTVLEDSINGNSKLEQKQSKNEEEDSEKFAANAPPDETKKTTAKSGEQVILGTMTVLEDSINGNNKLEQMLRKEEEEDNEKSAANAPPDETKKTKVKTRVSSRRVWSDVEKSVSTDGSYGIACYTRDYLYIASTVVLGLALTLVLVYFTVLRYAPWEPARIPSQNITEPVSDEFGNLSPTPVMTEQNTTTETPSISLFGMLDPIVPPSDSLSQSEPVSSEIGSESTETTVMAEQDTTTETPSISLFGMLGPIVPPSDSLSQSEPVSSEIGSESTETTVMAEQDTTTETPSISLFGMLGPIVPPSDSLSQPEPVSSEIGSVPPTWTTETTVVAEQDTTTETPSISLFGMLDPIVPPSDSLSQSEPVSSEIGSVPPTWTTETTVMAEQDTTTETPSISLFGMLDPIVPPSDSLPQSGDSGNVSFSLTSLSTTETTTKPEVDTDADNPETVGLFQILLPPSANSSQSDDSDSGTDGVTTVMSDTP